MTTLQALVIAFLGVVAAGVVLTRDPRCQAVAVSFYGLLLALAFFLYQAPDVALSQIAIGAVALPLMILLALTRVRREEERRARVRKREQPDS